MKSTLMNTPAIGLSGCVASVHSAYTGPNAPVQGTVLPFAAGTAVVPAAAEAAVAAVRTTDLPGSPPRGAPV